MHAKLRRVPEARCFLACTAKRTMAGSAGFLQIMQRLKWIH